MNKGHFFLHVLNYLYEVYCIGCVISCCQNCCENYPMATVPCSKLCTEYWTAGSVMDRKEKGMKTLKTN